jgi:ribosomal protein L37E
MSDATMKKCQYCGENVLVEAKKCKHCGEILDAQMREIENLKKQNNNPNVFMNSAASNGLPIGVRPFNHALHIILSLFTGGLWLLVYIPLYIFRNKQMYY